MIAYTDLGGNSRISINEGKDCQPIINCEIFLLVVFGGDGRCGWLMPSGVFWGQALKHKV